MLICLPASAMLNHIYTLVYSQALCKLLSSCAAHNHYSVSGPHSASICLVIGGSFKPSAPTCSRWANSLCPAASLWVENVSWYHWVLTGPLLVVCPPTAGWATSTHLRVVDQKVRALLNKLTVEKFDTISDQIIAWANKSESWERWMDTNSGHQARFWASYRRCQLEWDIRSALPQDGGDIQSQGLRSWDQEHGWQTHRWWSAFPQVPPEPVSRWLQMQVGCQKDHSTVCDSQWEDEGQE